jgi:hypothetical protein
METILARIRNVAQESIETFHTGEFLEFAANSEGDRRSDGAKICCADV